MCITKKQHSPFRKQKIRHENENQEDDQVKKSDRKRMQQTAFFAQNPAENAIGCIFCGIYW